MESGKRILSNPQEEAKIVGILWKQQAKRDLRKLTALKRGHSKEIEVAVDNIRKRFGALNQFAKLC